MDICVVVEERLKEGGKEMVGRTGASMHALSCCSSAIHPSAACPDDAQQPMMRQKRC